MYNMAAPWVMVLRTFIAVSLSLSPYIPQSVLLLEPSPPPSPQPEVEPEHPNHFTVDQLMSLHHQLKAVAPSGFMLCADLVNTVMRLAGQTLGGDKLPDNWKTVTREQVG